MAKVHCPVRLRVFWLPVVAVLLPCAFIAWLGYAWLALDRESAAHRGAEAAQQAAARLRDDLTTALRSAGEEINRSLGSLSSSRPPFQVLPAMPSLVSTAFLFDGSGTLVAPNEDAAVQNAINAFRQIRVGLPASDAPTATARGALLLERGRAALAAGDAAGVDRYASQIAVCCPGVRDEYGGSLLLYAAWQRASAHEHSLVSDAKGNQIAQELRQSVDRGYFGTTADAAQMSALARRLATVPDVVQLAARVEAISAESARRREIARLAGHWVAQRGAPTQGIAIGVLGPAAMTAALVSTPGGRMAVLILESAALDSWVARVGRRPRAVRYRGPSSQPSRAVRPDGRSAALCRSALRSHAGRPRSCRRPGRRSIAAASIRERGRRRGVPHDGTRLSGGPRRVA